MPSARIAEYNLPDFSIPFSPLDLKLPQVPVGVPSQLLERRPDIASAERQTAAANARIGVAISAYYPTISLSGAGGFESTHGGTWIEGPSAFWSLGAQAAELLSTPASATPSLTRRAISTRRRPRPTRTPSFWRFKTWKTSSPRCAFSMRKRSVEQRAVAAAQRSFDLSNQRYKGGATSYLEVLTAETALLNNQRTLTDLQTRQFTASVQLVRALGGGWDTTQLPK